MREEKGVLNERGRRFSELARLMKSLVTVIRLKRGEL